MYTAEHKIEATLMKTSTTCAAAVKKTISMIGIIRKGLENNTTSIRTPFYIQVHGAAIFRMLCAVLHIAKGYYGTGKGAGKSNQND